MVYSYSDILWATLSIFESSKYGNLFYNLNKYCDLFKLGTPLMQTMRLGTEACVTDAC